MVAAVGCRSLSVFENPVIRAKDESFRLLAAHRESSSA